MGGGYSVVGWRDVRWRGRKLVGGYKGRDVRWMSGKVVSGWVEECWVVGWSVGWRGCVVEA